MISRWVVYQKLLPILDRKSPRALLGVLYPASRLGSDTFRLGVSSVGLFLAYRVTIEVCLEFSRRMVSS